MPLISACDILAARNRVTHSSGNHGQGLSYAARAAGMPCTVVVPRTAPSSKVYGATIVQCESTMKSREETCEALAAKEGLKIVPPFDDHVVMAGQLLEQIPDLDAVFLAVGGGGLAAGVATFIKENKPAVKVFLVEPEGKGLSTYLKDGSIRSDVDSLNTVADGIRVLRVGSNPYPVLQKYCRDSVITVSESEIREAIALIWTRLKQRVEPTAGVPLAGLIKLAKQPHFELKDKNVAVILCGGNCDLDFVPV